MKQVIWLEDGTRVEIEGNNVKHIDVDGHLLYESEKLPVAEGTSGDFIKASRYFFMMNDYEKYKVKKWLDNIDNNRISGNKNVFINRVRDALEAIDYDYMIATLEPSCDEEGNLFYEEGNPVVTGVNLEKWKEMAKNYYLDSEWHSELANLYEGDLFKAYRIAKGYWTLEYVCDDSSSAGNYWNSPEASHDMEVSGARKVGGFKDGIGNTQQIYKSSFGMHVCGGCCADYGDDVPVVTRQPYGRSPYHVFLHGCGVVVLKRN